MTIRTEVLIVGAGPTGLTLAVDLTRRGIDCVVVERSPELPRQSRGKGLQPRSLEVFDDLGVVDRILSYAEERQLITLHADGRRLAELPAGLARPRPDVPYPNIAMIPQWRTTEVLLARLRELGGDVRFGWLVDGLVDETEADGDEVRAEVLAEDGVRREIRASYAVGCDGGGSRLRKWAGISFDGETRGSDRYLLGDVRVEGWEPTGRDGDGAFVRSHAWFGADGSFVGLAGLPSTDRWQIGLSVPEGVEPELSLAAYQRLWDERTARSDVTLSDASWLSDFSVNIRLVSAYRSGRILLAGDAAHVHPPTGGQGMNTGIQDAYNLGWKLAWRLRDRADDRLLDTYEAERLPVARGVLAKSTDILDVVTTRNPVTAFLVRRVVLPLLSRPKLNQALTGRVSQLDVGYPGGPLASESVRGGRPKAGERAPDGVGVDPAIGARTRLFDVFRGPHPTWLVLGGDELAAEPDLPADVRRCLVTAAEPPTGWAGRVLRDVDGTIRRAYRVAPGTGLLIRPDGYVAARYAPGAGTRESPFPVVAPVRKTG